MAFMIPEYLQSRAWRIDTKTDGVRPFFASLGEALDGLEGEALETWLEDSAPAYFADMLGEDEDAIYSVERDASPMFYYRLSAPGYMDATDWSGPYATREDAAADLESSHEVDAETGEALDADAEGETCG